MPYTQKIGPTTTQTQLVVVPDATLYTPGVVTLAQIEELAVGVSLAPVGSAPNADAATLTGSVLNLQPASDTFPGVMSAADKTKLDGLPSSSVTIEASVADFPPASTVTGQFFLDSSTGILYVSNGTSYEMVSGATGDVDIYADATLGNDANPGTQLLPVQTYDKAISLIPTTWSGTMNIHFAAGTYPCGNGYNGKGPTLTGAHGGSSTKGNLAFVGTMSAPEGTHTVTTGSLGDNLTSTELALSANEYRGAYIKFTTGANAGQMVMITSNTATELFFNVPFNNAVSNGETFQIQVPGTIFDVTGGYFFQGQTSRIALVGIKFTFDPVNGGLIAQEDYTALQFGACQVDMSNGFGWFANHNLEIFFYGADAGSLWGVSNNPFDLTGQNQFASMYLLNCNLNLQNSWFGGGLIMDNSSISPGDTAAQFEIIQLDGTNSSVGVSSTSSLNIYASNSNNFVTVRGSLSNGSGGAPLITDTAAAGSTTTVINLTTGGLTPGAEVGLLLRIGTENQVIIANTASTITVGVPFSVAPVAATPVAVFSVNNAISCYGNSNAQIYGLDINGSSADAVLVSGRSFAVLGDVGGTGNTGAGLHVGVMSQATYDSVATTVTGAEDALIGSTSETYAAITLANGISDVTGNRIQPNSVA